MSKRRRRGRNWQALDAETGDRVAIGLNVHKKNIHTGIRVNLGTSGSGRPTLGTCGT